MDPSGTGDFEAFFATAERPLRVALVAAFGTERGREAAADALAWAWQNWDRVQTFDNPVSYLFRVGQTHARRDASRASRRLGGDSSAWEMPAFEPKLSTSLGSLSEQQRVTVWMVHGLGYSQVEVAQLLECSPSSVATHLRRGMARLRQRLAVASDV
ncbi:MAG: sigma-70 family RNA polymerase sigma factor [Actinomycetota bacterium]